MQYKIRCIYCHKESVFVQGKDEYVCECKAQRFGHPSIEEMQKSLVLIEEGDKSKSSETNETKKPIREENNSSKQKKGKNNGDSIKDEVIQPRLKNLINGVEYELKNGINLIGRNTTNDVVLNNFDGDRRISNFHCRIDVKQESESSWKCFIYDDENNSFRGNLNLSTKELHSSKNGTYLKRDSVFRKIVTPIELMPNDTIGIAKWEVDGKVRFVTKLIINFNNIIDTEEDDDIEDTID